MVQCEPVGTRTNVSVDPKREVQCAGQRARNSRVSAAQIDVDGRGLALGRADAARVHWGMVSTVHAGIIKRRTPLGLDVSRCGRCTSGLARGGGCIVGVGGDEKCAHRVWRN